MCGVKLMDKLSCVEWRQRWSGLLWRTRRPCERWV